MTNLGSSVPGRKRFSRGRALVIAIAEYTSANPLPTAVINDARDVAAVLTSVDHCGYDVDKVSVLLDKEATLAGIRMELNKLVRESRSDETAIIYFSGHGVRMTESSGEFSALVPVDYNPANTAGSVLLESELTDLLKTIRASRLLVLLDACHSAGAGELKSEIGGGDLKFGFHEKTLDRLSHGVGRVMIASSKASETSLVMAGARNSLFTEHLLAALRGVDHSRSDGLIRVFETFSYISENVRKAAPGRQHPVFKAHDLEDDFPIALFRGGTKGVAPNPASTGSLDDWRQLEQVLAVLYPMGPLEEEIWSRAGGDVSRLRLDGTGRAKWFAALRTLRQGGGGSITREALILSVLDDFPHHRELTLMKVK